MASPLLPTKAIIQEFADNFGTILRQAGIPRHRWNMKGELEQAGYHISSTHSDYVGLWYQSDATMSTEDNRAEVHRIREILDKHIRNYPIVRLDSHWYQLTIELHDNGCNKPSMAVNITWVPKPRKRDKVRYLLKLGSLFPR